MKPYYSIPPNSIRKASNFHKLVVLLVNKNMSTGYNAVFTNDGAISLRNAH